jgi:hypothetical protein
MLPGGINMQYNAEVWQSNGTHFVEIDVIPFSSLPAPGDVASFKALIQSVLTARGYTFDGAKLYVGGVIY